MRYYKIVVTPSNGQARTWTSYVNGQTDPGALDIEVDLPVAPFAQPMARAHPYLRIWGISLADIAQASNFNPSIDGTTFSKIQIYGGMQKGLPLANPQQNGLLVEGNVLRSFGNWINTDQTLEFILGPSTDPVNKPSNVVHHWPAGTKLSDAISSTLKTAFPQYTADVQVSDNLVWPQDDVGHYTTITSYAQHIREISQAILGGQSSGVAIAIRGTQMIVRDDTNPGQPKEIAFTDLVGQPTWIGPNTIQVSMIMRADLAILDYIKLPPTPVTTQPQGAALMRNSSVFQGSFRINTMRHVGRFRVPLGQAWMTIVEASPTPKATGTVTVSDLSGG